MQSASGGSMFFGSTYTTEYCISDVLGDVMAIFAGITNAIRRKARTLLGEQGQMVLEIDKAMHELDGMLDRAARLANSHDGSPESAGWIPIMLNWYVCRNTIQICQIIHAFVFHDRL